MRITLLHRRRHTRARARGDEAHLRPPSGRFDYDPATLAVPEEADRLRHGIVVVLSKTMRPCIVASPSGGKTASVRRSLLFVPAPHQVRVSSAHRRLHVDLVVHPRLISVNGASRLAEWGEHR